MTSPRFLNYKASAVAILCVLFILPQNLFAQKGEIPITTSSKEALELFKKGRDKWHDVEPAAAAPLFEQAIQKDANFAMAYLYRARSGGGFNVSRQNLDKAVRLVDKVSSGERLWILAVQAAFDEDQPKRKEHLEELVKLFPSDKRVHQELGFYYDFVSGDCSTALEHYTKAAELDKNFAATYNSIGYCHSSLGNYGASEEAFKTYISLIPDRPNPYDSYAELLLKMGRYDESIVQYEKALEKDPSFTLSLNGIGHNYIFKGEYAKARESYQERFEKAPQINQKAGALFWIAISYVHEGKTEEALKAIDQLRTFAREENLIPIVIESHNEAGWILFESGDLAKAVKEYEKASALREESSLPESVKESFRLLAMSIRCRVLTAVHDFDGAMAHAEKVRAMVEARKNPDEERDLNDVLATLELERGNYDKAIALFSNGDIQSPYNWYYTAVAYEQKGDKANAMKLYGKIVNWNQNNLGYAIVRPRAIAKMAK
ncbi:MAG: tetratricopeptide repeat protein [Nitrososphaerales archaeon]